MGGEGEDGGVGGGGGGCPGRGYPKMGYMRPFELGFSPKFTIFDNKLIYAYDVLCIAQTHYKRKSADVS